MNFFIEGAQGAGKSTLIGKLAKRLKEHHAFREGDYNPVELAWCAYLTKERYESVLEKYAGIAEEIKIHTTIESKSASLNEKHIDALVSDEEKKQIKVFSRIVLAKTIMIK